MRTWSVDDVMTKAVVAVPGAATYRELVDLLVGRRFSAVPVVDDGQRVTGIVSETDLLRKIEYAGADEPRLFEGRRRRGERAKAVATTAAGLMTAPAVVIRAGSTVAAAARRLDAEHVKRLPVVDEEDRLVGIVTRGDLLKVHLRADDDILADVRTGPLHPYADTAHAEVADGLVTLRGQVVRWSAAASLERQVRQVPGVVAVRNELTFELDDGPLATTSFYGIA
ncbi:CBS domain-containing protein [Symbioplanes lichenis]|uniref:CBS domain-containing protein n=1 Tax=Symbioplanes lichenis TaxID=1629072 RepID=UPI00273A02E7|nr:CBS domain-containing protein [Actinoplanes lichenis]